MGGSTPKSLRLLAGRPLVRWAVDALSAVCDVVLVAGGSDFLDDVQAAVPDAVAVTGGAQRSDSVRACLAVLPAEVEFVLVHDAARPLASAELASRVLAALRDGAGAVVPVLPVADTVKVVDDDGWVIATPDRATLRVVQTPQGFARTVLVRAHASGADATDDAALVEAAGVRVRTVPGDPAAAKVTVPADLESLAAVAAGTGGSRG
ncbi:MAG TPA: 2-C-methyl-D-erythritol 4-phosphate cytidylyltransferase [Mycobacteriales bacterium]|nr:2-C-methyl-D-erythritol 4-phosphate cytidylyltransferase [Mycobacteriales bacterium]